MQTAAWNNLLCAEKKVLEKPIVKSSTIDSDSGSDFGSLPFPVSSCSSNTNSTDFPPLAGSTSLLEKKGEKEQIGKSENQNQNQPGSGALAKANKHGRKQQFAKDGTPWTEEVYRMTPTARLAWQLEHDPSPLATANGGKPSPAIALTLEDSITVRDGYIDRSVGLDGLNGDEPEVDYVPGSEAVVEEFVPVSSRKEKQPEDWRQADAKRVSMYRENGEYKGTETIMEEQMLVDFDWMMSFPTESVEDRDWVSNKKAQFYFNYGKRKYEELIASRKGTSERNPSDLEVVGS